MKSLIYITLFCTYFSTSFAGNLVLPQEAKSVIEKNQIYQNLIHDKSEHVWPIIQLWTLVKCEPKKCYNRFIDFNNHKNFIPNLEKSQIISSPPDEVHVAFSLNMPWPIKKSDYVIGHHLDEKNLYVDWYFVKGKHTKSSNGFIKFSEYGDKTLITYQNHVVPDSIFAGLFSKKVVTDTVVNMEAIIKELSRP